MNTKFSGTAEGGTLLLSNSAGPGTPLLSGGTGPRRRGLTTIRRVWVEESTIEGGAHGGEAVAHVEVVAARCSERAAAAANDEADEEVVAGARGSEVAAREVVVLEEGGAHGVEAVARVEVVAVRCSERAAAAANDEADEEVVVAGARGSEAAAREVDVLEEGGAHGAETVARVEVAAEVGEVVTGGARRAEGAVALRRGALPPLLRRSTRTRPLRPLPPRGTSPSSRHVSNSSGSIVVSNVVLPRDNAISVPSFVKTTTRRWLLEMPTMVRLSPVRRRYSCCLALGCAPCL